MINNIPKKTIYLSLSCILGLIVIAGLLAYGTNFNDPVSRMAKGAFPALVVGGRMVSIQTWDDYHKIANKLNSDNSEETDGDLLIRQLRQQDLLTNLRINVTPQDLSDELNFIKSSQEDKYADVIKEYFNNDEGLFQERVIIPRVYDKLLRMYHNTDPNSLRIEHKETNGILEKIKLGQKFESFISQSDDLVSAQLNGDLGFVQTEDILSELGKYLSKLPVGEVYQDLVVSRLGYHVLLVEEIAEEDGEKLYHLKHILIATDGFEEWQEAQLNKIKVWQIKN